MILKAGEGDDSDLYEVGGAATREEYIEFTGITPPEPDPEPEQQTAAEVVASITPDNAQQVLDEERSGKNRKTVIEAAEAALDQGEGD